MRYIEYTFIDKSNWPRGEWDNEPDKVQWMDETTDMPCLAVRHGKSGHWCGYVGVSKGHPLFEKDYIHGPEEAIRVHGGLTFSSHCAENDKQHGICHLVELGDDDNVWWLGFDCAHCDDISGIPYGRKYGLNKYGEYRTLQYVKQECASLAAQLRDVQNTNQGCR